MERPTLKPATTCGSACVVRQARKPYRCQAGRHAVADCQSIAPGDFYVEYLGDAGVGPGMCHEVIVALME